METNVERADRGRRAVVYGAHSLRHFFVSVATAAGMPAAMVKSITGHATDSMLEHYQHIGAGLAAELAVRISANGTSRAIPPALPPMDVDSGPTWPPLNKPSEALPST